MYWREKLVNSPEKKSDVIFAEAKEKRKRRKIVVANSRDSTTIMCFIATCFKNFDHDPYSPPYGQCCKPREIQRFSR